MTRLKAAPGASIVDARGGFLLPGFTDCHVHLGLDNLGGLVGVWHSGKRVR